MGGFSFFKAPIVGPAGARVNKTGLFEALEAKEAFREEAILARYLRKADALGINLEERLANFADDPHVRAQLGLSAPSRVGERGYYVLEYKPEYGLSLIQQLLAKRPEGVQIVVFAGANQREAMENLFAVEIGKEWLVLQDGDLGTFVDSTSRELGLSRDQIIHLNTGKDWKKAALLKKAVLTGAIGLAPQGMVVASERPLAGAHEITLVQILQAILEVEARRAAEVSA